MVVFFVILSPSTWQGRPNISCTRLGILQTDSWTAAALNGYRPGAGNAASWPIPPIHSFLISTAYPSPASSVSRMPVSSVFLYRKYKKLYIIYLYRIYSFLQLTIEISIHYTSFLSMIIHSNLYLSCFIRLYSAL